MTGDVILLQELGDTSVSRFSEVAAHHLYGWVMRI